MKKKAKQILVDETQFDAVLAQLLQKKPMPMKKIKTSGRRGPKTPMFPAKKSES